jgi:nucleotide-binding universal stress UspA family protein
MHVRTLVAGIATDPAGDPLLEPAVRLAERIDADLFLVHAFPADPRQRVRTGTDGPEWMDPDEAYRGDAEARMEERALALAPGARVFSIARPGHPEDVLAAVAAEVHADLLLLSPTRRGALSGRLLGTTAQQVVRHAPAPVLVLHGPLPEGARVLLTTDFSAHSHPAHARGVALARALAGAGSPLCTLHVAAPVYAEEGAGGASADAVRGRAELADFLQTGTAGRLGPEPRVRVGEPAREIVREAAEWGAELLVMGTHARSGAARLLLGSVAETVLRGAPCSVLVVPPAPAPAIT